MEQIKVIAFDADDTLWVNEPYFQEREKIFCRLLSEYLPCAEVSAELLKTEIQNIEIYGYGVKSFILSMMETAIKISDKKVSTETIDKIIILGKSLLEQSVELLADVEFVLDYLKNKYRLIVATKGDLVDQQRKLKKSGLAKYFDHVEVMSDKKESDYIDLLNRLAINPKEFLMVGNSLKSDILPVLAIGGQAVYIPYHTTWQHETININSVSGLYHEISKLVALLNILQNSIK